MKRRRPDWLAETMAREENLLRRPLRNTLGASQKAVQRTCCTAPVGAEAQVVFLACRGYAMASDVTGYLAEPEQVGGRGGVPGGDRPLRKLPRIADSPAVAVDVYTHTWRVAHQSSRLTGVAHLTGLLS